MIDILVRRVLPRVAALAGAVAIHAAGLRNGKAGILLIGRSGAGKSTLAAALAQTPGWKVSSEDVSVIREGAPPLIEPGPAGVCLWSESASALGLDARRCVPMPGYVGKLRYRPEGEPAAAAPLAALLFLERSDETARPAMTPLAAADALIGAIRQLVLLDPTDREELARKVALLSAILRTTPAYRLSFASGYGRLGQVGELLSRHFA